MRDGLDGGDKARVCRGGHLAWLFAIGGNAMADRFQKILVTAFGAQAGKAPGPVLNPPSHRDICDALEKGTCEEFRRVLTEHFAPYTDW